MSMPRPATSNGVTKLAPDRWRWRVMVNGVRHGGVAASEAAAKLARARAEYELRIGPVDGDSARFQQNP